MGNNLTGADREESALGNGIHIWTGERISVIGNQVRNHRDGIYFEFVKDSRIQGNHSEDNKRYGLHFMFSDGNEYRDNVFWRNGAGVAVMYSRNITMDNNRFERSWGGAAYGLLLKDIHSSRITRNRFAGNSTGIYMEGSNRSTFEENTFQENGWALRVLGDCEDNRFHHNNFVSNTFEVSTNSGSSHNVFSENYWSGYNGIDIHRDGIGAIPYRPVRFSSLLMEQYGTSLLLINSFFFRIADMVESVLPVAIPETLRDERPLLKPVQSSG
jgi:nitrous oxidase accessory protein